MSKIKVIISVVVATIALFIFAGEAPVEMLPIQLAAGVVLISLLKVNGMFKNSQEG